MKTSSQQSALQHSKNKIEPYYILKNSEAQTIYIVEHFVLINFVA